MFPFINPSITLENVQRGMDKGVAFITCRCVGCATEGGDANGRNNLRIYATGAFVCYKYGGEDKGHNLLIRSILRAEGGVASDVVYVDPSPRLEVDKVFDDTILDKLLPDYSYWEGRRIKADVLRRLQGGMAPKDERSKLSERFIFPCRDKDGRIVGFAGRLVKENSFAPKWKILGKKTSFVFPPPSISIKAIRSQSEVTLVEGIGCGLALMGGEIDNVFVMFGINLSPRLIALLVQLDPKRIRVSTNNEASGTGNRAAIEIKNKLKSFFNEDRIEICLPFKKDFAEMSLEEIEQWHNTVDFRCI